MEINLGVILQAVATALLIGALQQLADFRRKVQSWQDRMDVAMFGPDGRNGVYGSVKDHELRLRRLEVPTEGRGVTLHEL